MGPGTLLPRRLGHDDPGPLLLQPRRLPMDISQQVSCFVSHSSILDGPSPVDVLLLCGLLHRPLDFTRSAQLPCSVSSSSVLGSHPFCGRPDQLSSSSRPSIVFCGCPCPLFCLERVTRSYRGPGYIPLLQLPQCLPPLFSGLSCHLFGTACAGHPTSKSIRSTAKSFQPWRLYNPSSRPVLCPSPQAYSRSSKHRYHRLLPTSKPCPRTSRENGLSTSSCLKNLAFDRRSTSARAPMQKASPNVSRTTTKARSFPRNLDQEDILPNLDQENIISDITLTSCYSRSWH